MARFYALSIEESLFGDAALVREWGRIGTRGKRKIELHKDQDQAVQALEAWLRCKQRRGYRLAGPDQIILKTWELPTRLEVAGSLSSIALERADSS